MAKKGEFIFWSYKKVMYMNVRDFSKIIGVFTLKKKARAIPSWSSSQKPSFLKLDLA